MAAINPTRITNFIPVVTIDNKEVGAFRWHCNSPSYGAVGSFRIYTSREMVSQAGLDLYTVGKKAKGQIPVHINMRDLTTGTEYKLFGGEMDSVTIEYDDDIVIIEGRDWAGLLVDTKGSPAYQKVIGAQSQSAGASTVDPCTNAGTMSPTGTDSTVDSSIAEIDNGINLFNQTPSMLAYLIAVRNGFNPIIYTTPNELLVGDLVGGAAVNAMTIRPWWEFLQFLARMMGWNCYITPDKSLYFGPYDLTTTANISWGVGDITPGTIPARNMHITYNPRRNSTFLVLVGSYNSATAIQSVGAMGILNEATQKALQIVYPNINISMGKYTIGAAGAPSPFALSAFFSAFGKPVYFYSFPHLTPNQASIKALEIMLDIAKRELIFKASLDGNPFIKPMQVINMSGDLGDFSASTYYVNGVEHSYDIEEGWYTHVGAWTLPPVTTQQFLQANNINGVEVSTAPATLYKPLGVK